MNESRVLTLVIAVVLLSGVCGYLLSCRAGAMLLGVCGGQQQYLTDRVLQGINAAYRTSYELIDQVYGSSGQEVLPIPEGLSVSADRRTGIFCCTFDAYEAEKEQLIITGTYTLRQKQSVIFHGISLSIASVGAEPLMIEVIMRIGHQQYGKTLYDFDRCLVDAMSFPTGPLKESRIAAGPLSLDREGCIHIPALPRLE
jgi:hypothetical protein